MTYQLSESEKRRRISEVYIKLAEWGRERLAREATASGKPVDEEPADPEQGADDAPEPYES